jgi:hypothetical protein
MEITQDNSKYTIQEAIFEIMLQDKSKTWTFEELTNELGKVKKNFTQRFQVHSKLFVPEPAAQILRKSLSNSGIKNSNSKNNQLLFQKSFKKNFLKFSRSQKQLTEFLRTVIKFQRKLLSTNLECGS